VLAVLLGGCWDEDVVDAPECGDGICASGEQWQTCSLDCPRCPVCPPGYECQYPGGCHLIPRVLTVRVDAASLPAVRLDGPSWDDEPGSASLPDAFAVLRLDASATPTIVTSPISDTLEPRWATSVNVGNRADPFDVSIEVYDHDDTTDELVFTCAGELEIFPLAEFRCDAGGGSVHVQVGP